MSGNPKPDSPQDWRQIAEQACQEDDGNRLLEKINQLCDALDAQEGGKAPAESQQPEPEPERKSARKAK